MSKNTKEDLQRSHNKGQEDRSKGNYNPTVGVGVLDEMTTPKDTLDKWKELDNAYNRGWNNHK
jgi:hypothetical protein